MLAYCPEGTAEREVLKDLRGIPANKKKPVGSIWEEQEAFHVNPATGTAKLPKA